MSKQQDILNDLNDGIFVNMMDNLQRYGTSCRSRIAELRTEGHLIKSKVIHNSGALAYYISDAVKRKTQEV